MNLELIEFKKGDKYPVIGRTREGKVVLINSKAKKLPSPNELWVVKVRKNMPNYVIVDPLEKVDLERGEPRYLIGNRNIDVENKTVVVRIWVPQNKNPTTLTYKIKNVDVEVLKNATDEPFIHARFDLGKWVYEKDFYFGDSELKNLLKTFDKEDAYWELIKEQIKYLDAFEREMEEIGEINYTDYWGWRSLDFKKNYPSTKILDKGVKMDGDEVYTYFKLENGGYIELGEDGIYAVGLGENGLDLVKALAVIRAFVVISATKDFPAQTIASVIEMCTGKKLKPVGYANLRKILIRGDYATKTDDIYAVAEKLRDYVKEGSASIARSDEAIRDYISMYEEINGKKIIEME